MVIFHQLSSLAVSRIGLYLKNVIKFEKIQICAYFSLASVFADLLAIQINGIIDGTVILVPPKFT
jgi:hypothetical protein